MIELSEAEARARLEEMVAHDAEPLLSVGEIDDLLRFCKRADSARLAPGDSGWTETWDLNAGAAEGWRRKAGKVAGRFNVTVDGSVLSRAQAFANCLRMAEMYAARIAQTVLLGYDSEEVDVIGN